MPLIVNSIKIDFLFILLEDGLALYVKAMNHTAGPLGLMLVLLLIAIFRIFQYVLNNHPT